MTVTMLLIRHAEHVEFGRVLSGRRANVALSKEGLRQAEILSDLLGTLALAAVYSSPRERAWYTAREIAEPHALPVATDAGLEEIDFGRWEGCSFAELDDDPDWLSWNQSRGRARAPGGESMTEAADRAFATVARIAGEHPDRMVAAVSHCDIIRGIAARCLGLPLDNILRFDVDPASVSRIHFAGGRSRMTSINERLYQ